MTQQQRERIRVLVVDSEPVAERIAETLTSEYGMDTTVETSGADGLAKLEDEEIDCILCGDELPDRDGIDVLQTVQSEHEKVGFVLLAGRGETTGASEAITADGTDYILSLEVVDNERYGRLAERIRAVVTEKDRASRLERQKGRLEDFTSVVSHDLRNPLNVAQSSVELMEVEGTHIDRLDRSLLRMEQIIEDVVTLTRKGERVEESLPVDLGKEAKRAWAHAEDEATLDIEGTQRQIVADPERVAELLESLFDNAVEHAGDEPGERGDESEDVVTVTVGFRPDGFYVADDGPGIPESDREQVFEPGYSTGHHSAGLGLSIVREIAMAHGWDLRVTDSDAGGARFEITGVEFRDENP